MTQSNTTDLNTKMRQITPSTNSETCPCNSVSMFSLCCEPLLLGHHSAKTAEALMRSRYTAYVKRHSRYLLDTWHPTTRPEHIDPETFPDWYNLAIKTTTDGRVDSLKGHVEFIASARSHKSG